MVLRFYNTRIRSKGEFEALHGSKVGLYACGPTVYHYAHIGNYRAYVTWDVLHRLLERRKFKLTHVMNITDVGHLQSDADDTEDKMERAAREEKKSPQQIAEFYTHAFMQDLEKLHVIRPAIICKATDHIPEMIKLIQKLEKKGFTYSTGDGVYFNVEKFKSYGKFAGIALDQLKGVREEVNRDPGKKHPADFRLWQLNQPSHALQWDSPWGRGYPGWHIECSAMAMKYLGDRFDIHTGGMDNLFPHHQNEIAQSEGATGKPFANFWMHVTFMLVNGQKMSKSLRNTYTIADLEKKGFEGLDFRYLLLTAHYKSEMNFTWDSLEAARKTRKGWNDFIQRLQKYKGKKTSEAATNFMMNDLQKDHFERIEGFLDDDLNTPMVLAQLFEIQKAVNGYMDREEFSKSDTRKILEYLKDINEVLDVFEFDQPIHSIPAHVVKLGQERDAARKAKDWKKADSLRGALTKEGYSIVDTKDGFEIIPLG